MNGNEVVMNPSNHVSIISSSSLGFTDWELLGVLGSGLSIGFSIVVTLPMPPVGAENTQAMPLNLTIQLFNL